MNFSYYLSKEQVFEKPLKNGHFCLDSQLLSQETELYYLQSRYYDPEAGRFINADAFVSTGQDVLGNNMFAYCLNNPINYTDANGFTSEPSTHADSCECFLCSLERLLIELAAPDDDGNTFSVGLSLGYTFNYITQGIQYCISADTSNNYALQNTSSYGAATGFGVGGGLTFTYTNANNVQDLTGSSESIGGTVCVLGGISVDYITFVPASQPDRTCWGISITLSAGAELEGHANYNYTTSSESWNLWDALRGLFFGS